MIKRYRELASYVHEEFIAHLPFTLLGVFAGVAFVYVVMLLPDWRLFGEEQFHWAHVTHIFFSAAAGGAIFKSYRDSVLKAVPVATLSAILLCTLSDVLVPYLGLRFSGYDAHLHFCMLEHPYRVVLAALGGVVMGMAGVKFFAHCNRGFHLLHLLISTAASTLFLLNSIPHLDLRVMAVLMATLFMALVIPCLLGDVLIPLLFVRMKEPYTHQHVHHSGDKHSSCGA